MSQTPDETAAHLRRTVERLEKLQSITDAALSHLTLDDLLDELLIRVRDAFGADTAAVLLLSDGGSELIARAAKGIEEEVERGVRIPLGSGFAGRIAAEARPIILDRVDRTTVHNPILIEKGIRALLGAPLLARGRVLGVIHVGTLTERRFTEEEMHLLQVAAERVALALERAVVHEQLLHLDRVRHAFVSIASHELRTPTAAIYGAALTLDERAGYLEDEQERALRAMLAVQAKRLATLIEQLLDLSRLDAHAIEINAVPVRLRDEVETIVDGISAAQNGDVVVDVGNDLEITADPHALERVVGNLVVNALRHGAPPVIVAADANDRHLRLSVTDSGSGVPEDMQHRLFDEFARSEAASRTPGSGLGLAIARAYAHAQGGELLYDPSYRDGARFTLVLPLVPQ